MKKFNDFKQNNEKIGDLVEFCEKRKESAEKIAKKSKEKGGLSELTAWHYEAKLPAYAEAIKHIKNNNIKKFLDDKCKEFMSILNPEKMKQKEFQELIGKLEVYGEIICEINEK